MRRGPDYRMRVVYAEPHMFSLKAVYIPIELEHEFPEGCIVNWHDNGDDTYTLTPVIPL